MILHYVRKYLLPFLLVREPFVPFLVSMVVIVSNLSEIFSIVTDILRHYLKLEIIYPLFEMRGDDYERENTRR